MIPDHLTQLKEGLTLDYKQRISNPQKIAKTICAFANTRGGKLVIGVSDQRKITGIDPEEEKYLLEEAARQFCQPPVKYRLKEYENAEGLIVLEVKIPLSKHLPHSCLNEHQHWQVYVRQNDRSIPADAKLIKQLENQSNAHPAKPKPKSETDKVVAFIASRDKTTLPDICKYLNYGKRRVRKLLVHCVQIGAVREFNHESQPFYSL